MIAYLGFMRDTEVECTPIDRGVGAGEVDCFECGGDGDWAKFMPEPVTEPSLCVVCKGTGKIFVSIA